MKAFIRKENAIRFFFQNFLLFMCEMKQACGDTRTSASEADSGALKIEYSPQPGCKVFYTFNVIKKIYV